MFRKAVDQARNCSRRSVWESSGTVTEESMMTKSENQAFSIESTCVIGTSHTDTSLKMAASNHVLPDDLHSETQFIPLRILGNASSCSRKDSTSGPQEGRNVEHVRVRHPGQTGIEDSLATRDLLSEKCTPLLLPPFRALGPAKGRVFVQLEKGQF